jgi:hypothetical protein
MSSEKEQIQNICNALEYLINHPIRSEELPKNIAQTIIRQHRTHQQQFVSLLCQTIKELNSLYQKHGGFDLRNEESATWLKSISNISQNQYFPYI